MSKLTSQPKILTSLLLAGLSASAAMACSSGAPIAGDSTQVAATASALENGSDGDGYYESLAPRVKPGVADPGVRGGPPGAGGPIDGLNANELALFNEGIVRSSENEATCNGCQDLPAGQVRRPGQEDLTNSSGLGARFNDIQCMGTCHAQPTFGGSSPALNPSFRAASMKGATNVVPWFETIDGPTREVRFIYNPDGTRDGGVHQKFSTRGRVDAPACTLGQPDFSNHDNMVFRIPTPVFGLGLVDGLFDREIMGRAAQNPDRKEDLGIHGVANHSGNDGTITKFGWKAQNKSLFVFSGEAYTVEMGVTNELNPTQKVEDDDCGLGAHPNDVTLTGDGSEPMDPKDNFNNPLDELPDWMMFAIFMRFTAAPEPAPRNASAERGYEAFNQIGCAECHTETMHTQAGHTGNASLALRDRTFHPFSDILIHHMGATLADNVNQGGAGPDQFRTAPLWGVGQRLFFLHDGRARTLEAAILAHYSKPTKARRGTPAYGPSEANQVVKNFAELPADRQQDLLNFLRTL